MLIMKRKKVNRSYLIIFVMAMVVLTSVFAVRVKNEGFTSVMGTAGSSEQTSETTTETTTEEETQVHQVSTAVIRSAGDILIHNPVHRAAKKTDGSYDFSNMFTYVDNLISGCDYFVINLETTLGGTDGKEISGYPLFNSPDELVDNLEDVGVDCLLTANNHSYDSFSDGMIRTIKVIEKTKLDFIGTRKTTADPKFIVKEINGIKFGLICYTYETKPSSGYDKGLNGMNMNNEYAPLINSFDYNDLDSFYSEFKEQVKLMKQQGAEVITAYMHWGDEYRLTENTYQSSMAQHLCDLGVDVIVGGHPHVVEPVDLITSTDGKHKTVCVYSTGNIVSNQRRELMNLNTGHTEDGLIFEMTFSKYSDGTVSFDSVKSIPTWVHLYKENGKSVYSIVPLSKNLDDKASSLGLNKTSNGLSQAKKSYERTMAIVKEGTDKCNEYLKSSKK